MHARYQPAQVGLGKRTSSVRSENAAVRDSTVLHLGGAVGPCSSAVGKAKRHCSNTWPTSPPLHRPYAHEGISTAKRGNRPAHDFEWVTERPSVLVLGALRLELRVFANETADDSQHSDDDLIDRSIAGALLFWRQDSVRKLSHSFRAARLSKCEYVRRTSRTGASRIWRSRSWSSLPAICASTPALSFFSRPRNSEKY